MNLAEINFPYAPTLKAFTAKPIPRWQDSIPLHRPHVLPTTLIPLNPEAPCHEWFHPAVGIIFELEDVKADFSGDFPFWWEELDKAFHSIFLSFPVDAVNVDIRLSALHEVSDLVCDMAYRGEAAIFLVHSYPESIYRNSVIRHVPIGIFDPTSGDALWIHPAADAFDLLQCPFPASQEVRRLGDWAESMVSGGDAVEGLLDPETGLPLWACVVRKALEEAEPGRHFFHEEIIDAICNREGSPIPPEEREEVRLTALSKLAEAKAAFFGN